MSTPRCRNCDEPIPSAHPDSPHICLACAADEAALVEECRPKGPEEWTAADQLDRDYDYAGIDSEDF